MPKPNPDRPITEEVQLAQRIAYEREQRGMSYEGLAKRMEEEGCPIAPSAIYKTEKQGRRVVVEELIGYSRVFGIRVERLLLPAEVAKSEAVIAAWLKWQAARRDCLVALREFDDAASLLLVEIGDEPDLMEGVGRMTWGESWDRVREEWTEQRGGTVRELIESVINTPPSISEYEEEER